MDPVYTFHSEKNSKLVEERDISFEEVIVAIQEGHLLDILEHPNQEKYKHQKLYVVHVKEYVYLVPFTETKDEIFLVTIIPSRKAKQKYIK